MGSTAAASTSDTSDEPGSQDGSGSQAGERAPDPHRTGDVRGDGDRHRDITYQAGSEAGTATVVSAATLP